MFTSKKGFCWECCGRARKERASCRAGPLCFLGALVLLVDFFSWCAGLVEECFVLFGDEEFVHRCFLAFRVLDDPKISGCNEVLCAFFW